jgi:predicted GNAT family acetyltransferase
VDESRQITDNRVAQRYELAIDGRLSGVVEYREHEGVLALVHVEVLPELRGKGISAPFLDDVIELIAARDQKIRPICSYARSHVRDSPHLHGLVVSDGSH